MITREIIRLNSYSIESVVAEKMQTFLLKGVINSRTKDLYDLYILEKFIEKNDKFLKEAFIKTCENRKFEINNEKAMNTLKSVKSNMIQRKRWETYAKKMSYAKEVLFDDIISSINHLLEILI